MLTIFSDPAGITGRRRVALNTQQTLFEQLRAAGADKPALRGNRGANLAIISAYNDMLSAHQPMEHYPALIKMAARNAGASAQFAGGVLPC